MNPSLRVLVVDDSRAMLMVLRKMLAQCGYHNVETIGHGTEALRMMQARELEGRSYSVAILDYTMAPLTGLDLRRAMLGNRLFSKIPAVLMTDAEVAAGLAQDSRALFSSILLKPFSADVLSLAIEGAAETPQARFS